MNRPLTVKELADACNKQIAKGNGDRVIMISNDDEGNGYHYLWYEFQVSDTRRNYSKYDRPRYTNRVGYYRRIR